MPEKTQSQIDAEIFRELDKDDRDQLYTAVINARMGLREVSEKDVILIVRTALARCRLWNCEMDADWEEHLSYIPTVRRAYTKTPPAKKAL